MTQEDKELLLKDLCARLPYGFIVHRYSDNVDIEINDINTFSHFLEYSEDEDFKPYLRPMSSMTEEEKIVYRNLHHTEKWKHFNNVLEFDVVYSRDVPSYIDWLNANHFDYRGLIPKGLAIEVTKENNPYEK